MNLIDTFLSSINILEGLADNTVENYKRDLIQLLNYLNDKKLTFLNCKNDHLISFIIFLKKIYSNRSIARKISSIKHFFDFLQLEKIIVKNPSTLLKQTKIEQFLPNYLEQNLIEKLLDEAESDKTDYGIKFYCMLELLYSTGLRVSELVELKIYNLEKEFSLKTNNYIIKPFLQIKGKGNKARIVPINGKALKSLYKYLYLRDKLLNGQESEWLFTTKVIFSNKINSNTIQKLAKKDNFTSRQVFSKFLKNLCKKLNIDESKVSPHAIRHSVATILLKNGANLRFIQEFLGHSDISTTQIYTHLNDKQKEEAIKNYHPLAKEKLDLHIH